MAKPPPTRSSIKITRTLPYRGGTKEWSNRYFFDGIIAMTLTQFENMTDAIEALEVPCFSDATEWITATQYDAGSEIPVRTKDLSGQFGTLDYSTKPGAPGDAAIVVRFLTDQRTSKNHPIYLFKYYHDVWTAGLTQRDVVYATQLTKVDLLAAGLVAGISDGTATHKICGPYGAVAQDHTTLANVRHRDFVN